MHSQQPGPWAICLPSFMIVLPFKPSDTFSPTLLWCQCLLLDEACWMIGRLPACCPVCDCFVTMDGWSVPRYGVSSFVHAILLPLTFKLLTLSFSLLSHHWFFLLNWLLLWAGKHGIIYLIIKETLSFLSPLSPTVPVCCFLQQNALKQLFICTLSPFLLKPYQWPHL